MTTQNVGRTLGLTVLIHPYIRLKIQLTHHNMIIKDKTNDKTKSTDI